MVKSKIYIDKIYWERVQLFVEGHSENLDLEDSNFVLRNLTETRTMKANDVKIDGNQFVCRFNVAILDNGYYLPEDKYLLVNEQELDYIAQLNPDVINDAYQNLKPEQEEEYNELETQNGKINFLLQTYLKEFRKGGISKKTVYTVTPEISSDVNEFVLDVVVTTPEVKSIYIVRKYKELRKYFRKQSFNTRQFIFKAIFNTTKFFHLKKGNTVLFTSDSRPTMSGNFEYIYNEMLRQNLDKKYDIHTVFKANITDRRGIIDKFRLPYLLGKADYIFVDDFHPLIYTVRFRRSQEVIQVWHAVGAFKTVGFSRTGKKGGPFIDSLNHRSYTKAYVSSETDIPLNNAVVLFKMHPFVKNRLNIADKHKQYFVDVSDFREVNDILFITDLLISDYSSLIYEYAVFKKPMIFYAFDLEDYITTRDFYEPYESFVPGKIVQSFDALMDALDNEDYEGEKVIPFLDKHFKYQDGRSSERLVRNLFGS
ncbi:CDP-glycerol glycerophosphotransferase family protein [Staphylococcus aureus]|uniref:CDP-glycerol glycerophosphotransferase family protein n=1 Tax=Staphylococcus aureus TaxID=1280 RepID=UPI001C1F8A55|nr:CDP-glycerol glycerophosphotransferase family protein [Staphylococcus aureus]MBU7421110.1 CDP-glycerol glycerophosphotransferase family protein [Staphylococcus aureus]